MGTTNEEERDPTSEDSEGTPPGRRGRGRGRARPGNDVEGSGEDLELSSVEDRFREWLEEIDCDTSSVKVVLYKFDHPHSGPAKSQICKWEGELPDTHQIGLMFGSGRYLLWVNSNERGKYKAIALKIHPYYDELRRKSAMNGEQLPGMPVNYSQNTPYITPQRTPETGNGMEAAFGMVERVFALLTPIIASRAAQPDPAEKMLGMYAGLNRILQQSAIENSRLINESLRPRLPAPADSYDDEYEPEPGQGATMGQEPPKSILDQIIPLIGQFAPLLLGSSPAAQTAAQTIKQLPQFRNVVKDETELRAIIAHLDKTQGPKKTDAVLKRLGVTRPATVPGV